MTTAVNKGVSSAIAPDAGYPAGCRAPCSALPCAKMSPLLLFSLLLFTQHCTTTSEDTPSQHSVGVTSAITPNAAFTAGCSGSYAGKFGITVAKVDGAVQRETSNRLSSPWSRLPVWARVYRLRLRPMPAARVSAGRRGSCPGMFEVITPRAESVVKREMTGLLSLHRGR